MTQEEIRTNLKYYMDKIEAGAITAEQGYKMFLTTNQGETMKITPGARNRRPRITELILEGLSAGQIALRMGCTPSNVYNIRAKLIQEARIGHIKPEDRDMTPYAKLVDHNEHTIKQ